MYRRLILPAMIGLLAAFGGSPLALQQPIINVPGQSTVRRAKQRRLRSVHNTTPRTRKKHERDRPPHKNCQHRKHARARRRRARLKGRKG